MVRAYFKLSFHVLNKITVLKVKHSCLFSVYHFHVIQLITDFCITLNDPMRLLCYHASIIVYVLFLDVLFVYINFFI